MRLLWSGQAPWSVVGVGLLGLPILIGTACLVELVYDLGSERLGDLID